MALTEEQREAARMEYRRRLCRVRVEHADGSAAEFDAPIGGLDYLDIGALDRVFRQLGYSFTARGNDDIGAPIRVAPLEGGS